MPTISTEDNYLTVLNLFTTDKPENQDKLLTEMRKIVDSAAYEGWISSTMHAAEGSPGTANFIQWRSGEDLEKRYSAEEFKHRTMPVFSEITTSIRLLQNEIVYTQRHPSQGDATVISPDKGDYTVIEILKCADGDQDELVKALGAGQNWLVNVPGYRSHSVFKGLRARFLEGAFAVVYSQWEDRETYEAYRDMPDEEKPKPRRKAEDRIDALVTERDGNTYRAVHTRAAGD